MAWIYILIAGMFEVAWAIGLKYSEGFTRVYISLATAAAMIISFYFLAQGLKTIPVGTAYAVWTGIGAAGTALLGMILFDEPKDILRIICILLIITGIIGLKLVSSE